MDDRRIAPAARLAGLGAASGVAAWAVIRAARALGVPNDELVPGLQLGAAAIAPGLVFGLLTGAWLLRTRRLDRARAAGWALASALAYFAAYHVAWHVVAGGWLGEGLAAFAGAGLVGGACGSTLLALCAGPLLRVPLAALRPSIVAGTAAGALLPLLAADALELLLGFLAFFALWQAIYAASLAPALRRPAGP